MHLDDDEIQQYVLQKAMCDFNIVNHIHNCITCKTKAEVYNLLFEGIKQQEKPVFDFILTDLVMAQLPKSNISVSNDKLFFYCITFISQKVDEL